MANYTIRVVLTYADLPQVGEPEATFGLQDANKNLQSGEPQPDGALRFSFEITARLHPKTGQIDFAGPYVHGKLGERFFYLSLMDMRTGTWVRRIKVMLLDLGWDVIEAAAAPGAQVAARIIGVRGARAQLDDDGWHSEP